ncbi:hypothetical protein [Kribbella qitaiheensis]|uniref:hypothetical protein n=1 Tax=Kribbella qitaiheensis TaxID=1544730 RepID=UPI00162908E1|nr:hypothetical protein [Kribbella qitaiheensis]
MKGQHRRGWWSRFGALVNATVTDDAAGVIPGIEHFAIHGGSPVELRHYLADVRELALLFHREATP